MDADDEPAGAAVLTVPPGRALRVGGVDLHVRELGAGPPVLCLSGLGHASWAWEEVMVALAPRYRMIAVDNRGTGRSAKPPGPYAIGQMAADAAGVLDRLEIPAAHVIGHSMGGYLAQTIALARPALVCSLVLVGTSTARGGEPPPEETLEAWRTAGTLDPRTYAERTMPLSFAPGWTDTHPAAYRAYLERRLEFPTPPAAWQAQFQACLDLAVRGLDAERIRCPALVVHGARDSVLPFSHGRSLAAALPRAELLPFEDAGHLPHLEDRARFVAAVERFLASAAS